LKVASEQSDGICDKDTQERWLHRLPIVTDGGPIIGADHPVMTEMFVIPITGALCSSSNFRGVLARCFESADRCAGLAGNFQSKVLFEKKESEVLGETTVLQNRMHSSSSKQKIFDLLGTHCTPPSPVFFKFIHPCWLTNCGTGGGPSSHNMHTMLFIHPGLEHQP
jgi:hypothetical protein